MSEFRIAKRYADALYLKAQENGNAAAIADDMRNALALCKENREFAAFLGSPVIPAHSKAGAFNRIFAGFNELSKGLLQMLLGRKREELLPQVAEAFLQVWDKACGRVNARVISATALGDQAREQVSRFVQQQTGAKEVVLQTEENTDVIGGLVIRFEDKIFDTSIQTQIQKLKKELNIA